MISPNSSARLKPALRANGVGHLLSWRRRLGANTAGGVYGVLLADRVCEVGNTKTQLCQHVRLDPDPHRVVAGAEKDDLAYTGDAIKDVIDIDVGIVGKEESVMALFAGRRAQSQSSESRSTFEWTSQTG